MPKRLIVVMGPDAEVCTDTSGPNPPKNRYRLALQLWRLWGFAPYIYPFPWSDADTDYQERLDNIALTYRVFRGESYVLGCGLGGVVALHTFLSEPQNVPRIALLDAPIGETSCTTSQVADFALRRLPGLMADDRLLLRVTSFVSKIASGEEVLRATRPGITAANVTGSRASGSVIPWGLTVGSFAIGDWLKTGGLSNTRVSVTFK